MTRGTTYLLLPGGKIISSCEFNGDMYEGGHYEEIVKRLEQVKDTQGSIGNNAVKIADFKHEIMMFDKANHNYQSRDDGYFKFYEREIKEFSDMDGILDMRQKTYYDKWFSDYLFLLNLTGAPLEIREYEGTIKEIPTDKISTFKFGTFLRSH